MNEVTIYSIAKMTGVSAATVSRVLNNNPHISKATKLKVLKALEENGYVPNDLARNLSSKSSMMIGILVSDIRENKQSNTLHTLCQEFDQQGYSCLIYNTGFDPNNFAGFAKQLSQKKVDGAILMGTVFKCPEMEKAVKKYLSNIPVIIISGTLNGDNVYSIDCDINEGIGNCIKLLANKGRKCIGYVYASSASPNPKTLNELFETQIIKTGPFEHFMLPTERRPEEISDTINEIISKYPDVDGLIFSDDYLAIGAIRALYNIGKKVPDEVSIIGISNSRYTRMTIPLLTSLDTMLFDCALIAVRSMIHLIHGEYVSKSVTLKTQLIEREST